MGSATEVESVVEVEKERLVIGVIQLVAGEWLSQELALLSL